MKMELYQAETNKIVAVYKPILDSVSVRKKNNDTFTELELNGILHSLQVIIENAIGKAKHLLKYFNKQVPVSSHDAFDALQINKIISVGDLEKWRKIIGFRNTIVHEYMNVNLDLVDSILINREYQMIFDFLARSFEEFGGAEK